MRGLGSLPGQPIEICGEQSGVVDVFPRGSVILVVNTVTAMFSWFPSIIQRTKIELLEVAVPQGHRLTL